MNKVIDLSPLHNLGDGGIKNTDLVNGEHVILQCSMCNKKLCDIWITQPHLKVETEIYANCGHCGDRSYQKKIKGKFHIGIIDGTGITNISHDFKDTVDDYIYQRVSVDTKKL